MSAILTKPPAKLVPDKYYYARDPEGKSITGLAQSPSNCRRCFLVVRDGGSWRSYLPREGLTDILRVPAYDEFTALRRFASCAAVKLAKLARKADAADQQVILSLLRSFPKISRLSENYGDNS